MSPQQAHLSHPKYRPDIDGLRAVAVLSVLAFHAFPDWFQGGFIGVDVFFVISGYLISTIIFESLDTGAFSFREFYARRVKRIFPALLLVLIVSYAFGWFALLADEYKQLGKHIAAGAGFVSNIVLWNEASYFDNPEIKPLLHLWSLGVEEQFYILWPLLVYLAWKLKFNRLAIILSIAAISFYLNIAQVKIDPTAAFYSPQTRFWEILSGSLLAWATLNHKIRTTKAKLATWSSIVYNDKLPHVLSFIGPLLLVIGFIVINKGNAFPGMWALIPVLGAVLIISVGPQAWVNRTLLSSRIAVWFGLISYPLYLWHWPLLSFARIIEGEIPSIHIRTAALVLSVILAWLTYNLLEKPLRLANFNAKTLMLTLLMVAVGFAGYFTYSRDGLSFRVKSFDKISKAAGEWAYPGSLQSKAFNGRIFRYQSSGVHETTLFVGDSNIEQYYVRIDELIKTKPETTNSVIFTTGSGCAPIPAFAYDDKKRHCVGLMETALKLAIQDPQIHNVVIGGHWNGYLYRAKIGSELYYTSISKLEAYINELNAQGKKVFLMLNIPTGEELDPKYMAHRSLNHFPSLLTIRTGGIPREKLDKKFGKIQQDLSEMAQRSGAEIIRPLAFLCDESYCPSVGSDGEPIYKDSGHLRPSFVRTKAKYMDVTVTSR